ISAYVSFGNLRIYNRYGQQIYLAKALSEYWDGNYNGQNLPAGIYYWIFEGVDSYYSTKITKAGSIALLR
ncbi:MAG: hypothetical protein JWR67_1178, partial [Mucilaginibacter sp.]|nr:hypothetical protein [Mucilaginibacter sp.]